MDNVPPIRSGSCAPNIPANGPSVPGGSARVSSRACRMRGPSCSSTRNESYIFRTFQSMPAPISGAPTAVSATGGSAVERPNQLAKVCMIGSRNHHAHASTPMRSTAQPSLKAPLRQPFMVFDLIHRACATWLERALHQVHLVDGDGFVEIRSCQNRFESREIDRK